jgi:hypothetical protein
MSIDILFITPNSSKKVYQDFGRDKSRWYYRSPIIELDMLVNTWTVDFIFRDPHDATMFGLKYLK